MCRLYTLHMCLCLCVQVFVCMCTHTVILFSLDIPIVNLILLVHILYVTIVSIDCSLVGCVFVTVFTVSHQLHLIDIVLYIFKTIHTHTSPKTNLSAGNQTTNNCHSHMPTIYLKETFQEHNNFSPIVFAWYLPTTVQ